MVKIGLQLKASFENVELMTPPPDPNFRWYMKFACNNCGEVSSKWNYISLAEEKPAVRGSAVNHFVNKCKLCARVNSLSIIPETISGIDVDSNNQYKTIVVLDCRGLEPKEFSAREGWCVKTVDKGTIFTDVDLSEGEWADYCDKINQPVRVYEIQHNFVTVK